MNKIAVVAVLASIGLSGCSSAPCKSAASMGGDYWVLVRNEAIQHGASLSEAALLADAEVYSLKAQLRSIDDKQKVILQKQKHDLQEAQMANEAHAAELRDALNDRVKSKMRTVMNIHIESDRPVIVLPGFQGGMPGDPKDHE